MTQTPIATFIDDLESKYGAVARRIDVDVDPETGRKLCRGEKNNLTQEQIEADRGSGSTWSIALKYCPGLVCVDFDQKDLETSALWALLVERDCLRVETAKGWHVYVRTDAPAGGRELAVGGDVKIDLLVSQRNVWETDDRVLTGALIEIGWSELSAHLQVGEPKNKRKAQEPLPRKLHAYLEHKFPIVHGMTHKQDVQRTSKRRGDRTITTETPIDCWSLNLGHDCPLSGTTHNNHVYLDIVAAIETGAIVSVKIRCMSPHCDEEPTDVTFEAVNYAQCCIWNEKVAFVAKTASFVYTAPGQDPVGIASREAIDMIMSAHSTIDAATWLKCPDAKRYHKQSFYPSLTPPEDTYGLGQDLNLFTGFAVQPDATADPALAQPLLDHIRDIWCKGAAVHYHYVMGMFASMLQRPWEKNAVVLCLVSKQGSGKGIVLSKLGEIMGPQTFKQVSDPNHVFGDFNEVLSCGVCIVLDEMLYAGNKAASNHFKSLITESTIRINPKYGKPWTETMYQNYVITSNSPWIIQASADQRRFFCLEPSDQHSGVNTPETCAYFQTLLDVPTASFAHVLYNWDLSEFNPRQIPSSLALVNQQKESLSAVESAVYECLQRGMLSLGNGVFLDDLYFGQPVSRSALFQRWTEEFGATYGWPTKAVKFWAELKRILGVHLNMDAGRRTVRGRRDRCVDVHDLRLVREHWDRTYFRDDWDS